MFTNGNHEPPSPPVEPPAPPNAPAEPPAPPNAAAEPPTSLAEPEPGHATEEAALSRAGAELDAVEAALGRLEDGSFDRCDVCGGPIGRERLLQNPLLTRCPQHTPEAHTPD